MILVKNDFFFFFLFSFDPNHFWVGGIEKVACARFGFSNFTGLGRRAQKLNYYESGVLRYERVLRSYECVVSVLRKCIPSMTLCLEGFGTLNELRYCLYLPYQSKATWIHDILFIYSKSKIITIAKLT